MLRRARREMKKGGEGDSKQANKPAIAVTERKIKANMVCRSIDGCEQTGLNDPIGRLGQSGRFLGVLGLAAERCQDGFKALYCIESGYIHLSPKREPM